MTVPSTREFFFQPNMSLVVPYYVLNNAGGQYIQIEVQGDLAEYAYATEDQIWIDASSRHYVELHINLPEDIDSGIHEISIVATEIEAEGSGNVIAKTAVRNRLKFYKPYPDDYILAELDLLESDKNTVCEFEADVNNLGSNDNVVTFDKISIIAVDTNETIIEATPMPRTYFIEKENHNTLTLELSECLDLPASIYKVKFDYSFADQSKSSFSELRVGSFDISVLNFTKDLTSGKINKFNLELQSIWNKGINQVSFKFTILDENGKPITYSESSLFDTSPWQIIDKQVFIDAPETPGEYNAQLILYYPDENGKRKEVVKDFKINVEKQRFDLVGLAIDNTGSIIIGVSFIILLIGLYIIKNRSNNKQQSKTKIRKKKK